MKTKLSILVLALASLFFVACTESQQSNQDDVAQSDNTPKVENYIVLTSNIQQIRSISHAAQLMKFSRPTPWEKWKWWCVAKQLKRPPIPM